MEMPVFGSHLRKIGKGKLQYEAYLMVGFLISSYTGLGIPEPTACEEIICNNSLIPTSFHYTCFSLNQILLLDIFNLIQNLL